MRHSKVATRNGKNHNTSNEKNKTNMGYIRMQKYESIQEVMENGYKYIAEALGITEQEARQAMHDEMMQTEKIKRARKLIDTATLKSMMFRDQMLNDMAKWDEENPDEPIQLKYTIYATLEPKNHS